MSEDKLSAIRFQCHCARCGRRVDHGTYLQQGTHGLVLQNSEINRWAKDGDKYYCPSCWKIIKDRLK